MLLANTHVLQRGRVGRAAVHRAAWESCFLRGVKVPLADTHVLQRGGCLGKAGVLKGCLRKQLPWFRWGCRWSSTLLLHTLCEPGAGKAVVKALYPFLFSIQSCLASHRVEHGTPDCD